VTKVVSESSVSSLLLVPTELFLLSLLPWLNLASYHLNYFNPEDGSSKFLRTASIYHQGYVVSKTRRPHSELLYPSVINFRQCK
jgi:hypothetical protein